MNKLKTWFWLGIAISVLPGLTSCSPKKTSPKASGPPIPAGPLMRDDIAFQFAIYYLPVPTKDPIVTLDALLAQKFSQVKKVTQLEPGRPGIFLVPEVITNVPVRYSAPSMESLRYFGRGLSRDQALALQQSQHALLLNFGYTKEHRWDGMRLALQLTSALAQQSGALIWDEETREVFTPDVWRTNRLEVWETDAPDIARHTTTHAYRDEDKNRARAITLGMIKFGLPDIVVEDYLWSNSPNIGNLINGFGQIIAEGAPVPRTGEFDLDVRAIKNSRVRDGLLFNVKANATGRAMLALQEGRKDEGDPTNRLVEISFDRYNDRDLHGRQDQLLTTMFGREESVIGARRDDEELQAASRRAREKLPGLRERFNKGQPPGEHLLIKASFRTSNGGKEYMWVEVFAWSGERITGLLRDEPMYVPGLHGGQTVTVSEKDVFDYARFLPDGTKEGDETSEILKRREGIR